MRFGSPKQTDNVVEKKQLVPRDDLDSRDFGSATPIAELVEPFASASAQTEVSTPETTMNQDHAYIHREWHRAASMRDLPALLALYAGDATLESPLVPAVLNDKSDGVLRGKAEIAHFLEM